MGVKVCGRTRTRTKMVFGFFNLVQYFIEVFVAIFALYCLFCYHCVKLAFFTAKVIGYVRFVIAQIFLYSIFGFEKCFVTI